MAAVRIEHPNRDKAGSKATKAIVILLLVSAAPIAIVTFGGWSELQGAQPVAFAYIVLYVVIAVFVARWKRGGCCRWPRPLRCGGCGRRSGVVRA